MVSTLKLVYDFYLHYSAANSGSRAEIDLVDVIAYLNKAQQLWFTSLAAVYESDATISHELREYELKSVPLNLDSNIDGVSKFLYPENLYKRLSQYSIAKKDCCPNSKKINITITPTDKLNLVRKNPLFKADFFWEQLPGDDASGGLYVYHDDAFEVESVIIDYLRIPGELHAPSALLECGDSEYETSIRDLITEDTSFEGTNTFADNKITDLAVMMAKGDRSDYEAFNKQLQQIIFTKNI